MSRDEDDVGVGLGHAGRDGADTGGGDELHADLGARVDLLEVVDQLRQVLDGIDVVVRRRRDERHAGHAVAELCDQSGDLVAGELAAFAGLRALGHLDLDLGSAGEVFGRDTEAAGRDLLDGGVAFRAVARRVFAAFAGVRLAADLVHRDGEALVGLGRKRAEGHAGRGEAAADVLDGLNLVDRHGCVRGDEIEQVARADGLALVDRLHVFEELLALAAALDEAVEREHDLRVEGVELATAALGDLVVAAVVERGRFGSTVAGLMTAHGVVANLLQADAADLRNGSQEREVDDFLRDADGFEGLRPAIAGDGRDAHLRHDLQHSVLDAGAEVGDRLVERDRAVFPGLDRLTNGVDGDVGIDGRRAEADEAGEVVDVPGFARLADEGAAEPLAFADEVMVHRADGEQHRDRDLGRFSAAVAEDEDGFAGIDRRGCAAAEILQRSLEIRGTDLRVEEAEERLRLEGGVVDLAKRMELVVEEERAVDTDHLGMFGRLGQPGLATPEARRKRHDDLLSDRVDRRIRHLGEELLEVVVEQSGALREEGERGVVAHRADGFLARGRHGLEEFLQLLVVPAEGDLLEREVEQVDRLEVGAEGLGVFGERELLLRAPGGVGLESRDVGLALVVGQELSGRRVDREDLAGPETALLHDLLFVERNDAGFGAHDQEAVLVDLEARGAEAVAVERGADITAVGEDHGGRAVPGFIEAGVELVEALQVGGHVGHLLPRFGREHHHAVKHVAAAELEEFEGVVEGGGVRAAGLDDGLEVLDVVAPDLRGHLAFAGGGPVLVPHERVDLAVVRDHAERMGQRPVGEGVRRIPLVVDGERRGEEGILQVGVELLQLGRVEEPLVDDRARGERRDVERVDAFLGRASFGHLAGEIQAALEIDVAPPVRPAHEDLLDLGHRLAGLVAEAAGVHGHGPPAEHVDAELRAGLLDDRLAGADLILVAPGHEHDAHGEVGVLDELAPELLDLAAEERVRDLGQHAGAVAGFRVGVERAAVGEVAKRLDGVIQDPELFLARDVRDEPDAAGVVLELGTIHRFRETRIFGVHFSGLYPDRREDCGCRANSCKRILGPDRENRAGEFRLDCPRRPHRFSVGMSEPRPAEPVMPTESQRRALIVLLGDEDDAIARTASDRLKACGSIACDWLKPHLLSNDALLRRRARSIVSHFNRMKADNAFLGFALQSGEELNMEQGIWLLARTQYPDLNEAAYAAQLDGFAEQLAAMLPVGGDSDTLMATVNEFLFDKLGFHGNQDNYYQLENSYMNKVVDRRTGTPISLCAVYMLVMKRIGLPVAGVGLPGHFIVRFQSATAEVYVDCFNRGKLWTKANCNSYILGTGHNLQEGFLQPVTPRRMLQRMCSNLHQIYSQQELPEETERLGRYLVALAR